MNFTGTMNNEDLLNRIVHLMQTDQSADAPADAVQWTKNLFRTRAVEPKQSFVQKVLAVLQMDLAPNKAVFGERSASASQARQMLFGAGDNSIDLRIEQTGKSFTIKGQILGEGFANAEIKISSAENSYAVQSNELSEFKFEKVANGEYSLSLICNNQEIFIENIKIS